MRKVIKQNNVGTIDLALINDNSKLAIKWSSGDISLIIEKKTKEFCGYNYLTHNILDAWFVDSKRKYVEQAFKQEGTEVFEFSTYKELYEWLSQQ